MFSKTLYSSLLLAVLVSVSACSTTKQVNSQDKTQPQANIQQAQPPKIPVIPSAKEVAQKEIESNRKYVESQIVKKDGKTTYFYDKEFNRVKRKTADGFYRVVLGKTADGNCIIQDFYAKTNKKQSEPAIYAQGNCDSGAAEDIYDGAFISYDENQLIRDTFYRFRKGKMITAIDDDKYIECDPDTGSVTLVGTCPSCEIITTATFNKNGSGKLNTFINDGQDQLIVETQFIDGQVDPKNSFFWRNNERTPLNRCNLSHECNEAQRDALKGSQELYDDLKKELIKLKVF
ncbi:MAG: hypothetical protein IJ187_02815 [Neisseriaceae bacterium]|nr:hypothetical protein [Neisseriaceae bacterium]